MTIKMTHIAVALMFASVSVAHAETSGQPTQPAAQGAASVEKNLEADKSGGHADKGLNTALSHVTAEHGKAEESESKAEKAETAAKPERPAMPELPAKPERGGR